VKRELAGDEQLTKCATREGKKSQPKKANTQNETKSEFGVKVKSPRFPFCALSTCPRPRLIKAARDRSVACFFFRRAAAAHRPRC